MSFGTLAAGLGVGAVAEVARRGFGVRQSEQGEPRRSQQIHLTPFSMSPGSVRARVRHNQIIRSNTCTFSRILASV